MNSEQLEHEQYQWATPTHTTSMTTTMAQSMDNNSNNNMNKNTNNNDNSSSIMCGSMHTHNMEIRQQQRINQIDDEREHVQICNESQRELLHDTLQNLRQRVRDIEQDHWKYDIVR